MGLCTYVPLKRAERFGLLALYQRQFFFFALCLHGSIIKRFGPAGQELRLGQFASIRDYRQNVALYWVHLNVGLAS